MRTNRSIASLREDIARCLNQLRLGALIEQLELQYENPAFSSQCFERRLFEALQQTCDARSGKVFAKLMNTSNLSADVAQADFEDYLVTPLREKFSSLIDELKTGEWMRAERPLNLVIVGPTGAGKSWLACAFARQACRLNLKVLYVTSTKAVLSQLNGNEKLMTKLIKTQVLILDDFLLNQLTEMECQHMHTVIQARYQRRPTIILSQHPMETWIHVLPSGSAGDAIVDRIVHFTRYIQLTGEKSLR